MNNYCRQKIKYLIFGDPESSIVRSYKMERSGQRKTKTKYRLEYLTLDDPGGSRSLIKIYEVPNFEKVVRYRIRVQHRYI